MDWLILYLVVTAISLPLIWLGIVLHWRSEGMLMSVADVRFFIGFSLIGLVPVAQIAVLISVWLIYILTIVSKVWNNFTTVNALQTIADRLNSIIHYRKVKG